MIEVHGLTKRFGGLVAVNAISIHVEAGETVGLIGPNGAGKTTLFNCIAGFYSPEEGTVLLDGRDITGLKPERVCRFGLARTFQSAKPFGDLSVRDNVMVGAFNRVGSASSARQEADTCLKIVGLGDRADDYAKDLTLCDKKKMEISRSLATRPRYLLLDEVMAGLNPTEMQDIIGLLKQLSLSGLGVVVIEHIMSAIMNVSNRIVVMQDGKLLAEGRPAEIARNPAVIEAYLGKAKTYA